MRCCLYDSKKSLRIDIVSKLNARNTVTAAVDIQLPMRCTPALLFPTFFFRQPPDTVTDWNHPTMLRICGKRSSNCLAWHVIHVPCRPSIAQTMLRSTFLTLPPSPQRCGSKPFLTTSHFFDVAQIVARIGLRRAIDVTVLRIWDMQSPPASCVDAPLPSLAIRNLYCRFVTNPTYSLHIKPVMLTPHILPETCWKRSLHSSFIAQCASLPGRLVACDQH